MSKLLELSVIFLKLGTVAFGGPVAHIAMMEEEFVEKRKWLTRDHFLDLIGATNLIPGPNSTEMAMHLGFVRARFAGLVVAGVSFILPAVCLTGALAYLYIHYGYLPKFEAVFLGIRAAILALILSAILKLGKKAVKNRTLGVIGIIALALVLYGVNEVAALFIAGLLGTVWTYSSDTFFKRGSPKVALVPLFLVFLKIGAILFGSGYVLIAYLQGELVEGLHWLNEAALLDAVAIGQMTPGPVLSTSTFIGYYLSGVEGAIVATVGMFLPAFFFVAVTSPFISKIRRVPILGCFLDSVNVAAVGLMSAVLIHLVQTSIVDAKSATICVLAVVYVYFVKKVNVFLLVGVSAVAGFVLF